MRRRALLALVGTALAGCGEEAELSPLCVGDTAGMERALAAAPEAVRLADGSSLSQCVSGAVTAGELQDFGVTATRVAERLERRAARDPRAAVQLGYLVGAARRGAAETNGVNVEVVRRLERSADLDAASPAAGEALGRGVAAGEATG